MFARVTSRRQAQAAGRSRHQAQGPTNARPTTSVMEPLEGRRLFAAWWDNGFDAIFGDPLSGLVQTDPFTGQQALGGYPITGGALGGILGTDWANYATNPTPQTIAAFVNGITSGFSPYNLDDPTSFFYQQFAVPNGSPFPNYNLWLLMNGFPPQASPDFASLLGTQQAYVPADPWYVEVPGIYDSVWNSWYDLFAILENAGGEYGGGGPVFSEDPIADSGDPGNAGSSSDPGDSGSAGSAMPVPAPVEAPPPVTSQPVQPPVTVEQPPPPAPARVAPERTRADLKLIGKIEKLSRKVGRTVEDLTYHTAAELQQLHRTLKELPKKQATLRKIEATAAKRGVQVPEHVRDLAAPLAEMKSYLKQIKARR